MEHDVVVRKGVRAGDREAVRAIVESTGFFHPYETETALELVDEALAKGEEASGYRFLFLETAGRRPLTAGYVCYGEIPCTRSRFDLYWIAVLDDMRGKGFGRILLCAAEEEIRALGGKIIFLETSSRPQYEPTRNFYLSAGYSIAADIADYYEDGEGMIIFRKYLDD